VEEQYEQQVVRLQVEKERAEDAQVSSYQSPPEYLLVLMASVL
jgi:hypothetical protein